MDAKADMHHNIKQPLKKEVPLLQYNLILYMSFSLA